MHARGYSLIEMVVVVAVISILLAIGTLRFNDYARRYRAESQTRTIYSELLNARASAFFQRKERRVKLYANRFEVYSSLVDSVAPVINQTLSYPITWNRAGNNLDFDQNGIASLKRSICIDTGDVTGTVDSVVVHSIRVSIGKKDKGDACSADNITTQ